MFFKPISYYQLHEYIIQINRLIQHFSEWVLGVNGAVCPSKHPHDFCDRLRVLRMQLYFIRIPHACDLSKPGDTEATDVRGCACSITIDPVL